MPSHTLILFPAILCTAFGQLQYVVLISHVREFYVIADNLMQKAILKKKKKKEDYWCGGI